mmetsp:Transcript_110686/g.300334  ORF Transcript_110686/g.300334 Transcript_110686/m.300334 type:complete len:226 (+) Transcript_110686:529-1206(+)
MVFPFTLRNSICSSVPMSSSKSVWLIFMVSLHVLFSMLSPTSSVASAAQPGCAHPKCAEKFWAWNSFANVSLNFAMVSLIFARSTWAGCHSKRLRTRHDTVASPSSRLPFLGNSSTMLLSFPSTNSWPSSLMILSTSSSFTHGYHAFCASSVLPDAIGLQFTPTVSPFALKNSTRSLLLYSSSKSVAWTAMLSWHSLRCSSEWLKSCGKVALATQPTAPHVKFTF